MKINFNGIKCCVTVALVTLWAVTAGSLPLVAADLWTTPFIPDGVEGAGDTQAWGWPADRTAEGWYVVDAAFEDAFGNLGESDPLTFFIDRQAPMATVTIPETVSDRASADLQISVVDNLMPTASIMLSFANGGKVIRSVAMVVTAGVPVSFPLPAEAMGPSDAELGYTVTASDAADNASTVTGSLMVDRWAPQVTVVSAVTSGNMLPVVLRVIDADSPRLGGATVSMAGATMSLSEVPKGDAIAVTLDVSTFSDGRHAVDIAVWDAAGHVSSATASATVDRTAPMMAVTGTFTLLEMTGDVLGVTVSGTDRYSDTLIGQMQWAGGVEALIVSADGRTKRIDIPLARLVTGLPTANADHAVDVPMTISLWDALGNVAATTSTVTVVRALPSPKLTHSIFASEKVALSVTTDLSAASQLTAVLPDLWMDVDLVRPENGVDQGGPITNRWLWVQRLRSAGLSATDNWAVTVPRAQVGDGLGYVLRTTYRRGDRILGQTVFAEAPVRIWNAAPNIEALALAKRHVASGDVSVTGTVMADANPDVTVRWAIVSANNIMASGSESLAAFSQWRSSTDPMTEGVYTLQAVASSPYGYTSTWNRDFVIDRTPPVAAFKTADVNAVLHVLEKPLVEITATANEAIATASVVVFGEDGQSIPAALGLRMASAGVTVLWDGRRDVANLLPNGRYRVETKMTDLAGNAATASTWVNHEMTVPRMWVELPARQAVAPGVTTTNAVIHVEEILADIDVILLREGSRESVMTLGHEGTAQIGAGSYEITLTGQDGAGHALRDGGYIVRVMGQSRAGSKTLESEVRFSVNSEVPVTAPQLATALWLENRTPYTLNNLSAKSNWALNVALKTSAGEPVATVYEKALYSTENVPAALMIPAAMMDVMPTGGYQLVVQTQTDAGVAATSVVTFNYQHTVTGSVTADWSQMIPARATGEVASPYLTPNGDGVADRLSMTVHSATVLGEAQVSAWVVAENDARVATLAVSQRVTGDVRLSWGGLNGQGAFVPDGRYGVVVRSVSQYGDLLDEKSWPIWVVAERPKIQIEYTTPIYWSPNQDKKLDQVTADIRINASPLMSGAMTLRWFLTTDGQSTTEAVKTVVAGRIPLVLDAALAEQTTTRDQQWEIMASVTDGWGNTTSASIGTVIVDCTPPNVGQVRTMETVSVLGREMSPTDHVVLTVNAEPGSTLMLSYLDQQLTSMVASEGPTRLTSSQLADGAYDLTLFATDLAGNTVSQNLAVGIDTTPPHIQSQSAVPAVPVGIGATIRISATANEVLSDVILSVNDQRLDAVATGNMLSADWVVPEGIASAPEVRLVAMDAVGHRMEIDLPVGIVVDAIRPTVVHTQVPIATNKRTLLIGVTASEPGSIVVTNTDIEATPSATAQATPSAVVPVPMTSGTNTLLITAVDGVGNVSIPVTRSVIYETDPPYVHSVILPQPILKVGFYSVTVNISEALEEVPSLNVTGVGVTANWIAVPEVGSNGQAVGVLGVTVDVIAKDSATVYMGLQDVAGNVATGSMMLALDTVVPTVSVTGFPAEMVYQWPVLKANAVDNRGQVSMRYAWNAGQWQNMEAEMVITTAALDPTVTENHLVVEAKDEAGNAGQFEGILRADVLRPYVTAMAMTPTLSREGTVSVTVETHGRPVTPDVVINGRSVVWLGQSDSGNYAQSFHGVFRVVSEDRQGTADMALSIADRSGVVRMSNDVLAQVVPLVIDTVAPTVAATVATGANWADQTWFSNADGLTWRLTASEGIRLADIAGQNTIVSASVAGSVADIEVRKSGVEGPATASVSVIDAAGNRTPITVSWVWDAVVPQVQSVVMTNGFVTWNQAEAPTLGARETSVYLTMDEPIVAPKTSRLTLSNSVGRELPIETLMVSGNRVIGQVLASQWRQLGDGEATLRLEGLTDRAGNTIQPFVVTAQVDTVPPVMAGGYWQSTALGVTQSVVGDSRYKLSDAGATFVLQWSEVITTPDFALRGKISGKTVTGQLMSHNGVETRVNTVPGSDWTGESFKDAIALEPLIEAFDLAGNRVANPVIDVALDLQAPQVVERGVDGGARDSEGFAVIKPYGVSGEEDELRFWVGFSEPTYQPAIKIYRVAADEADDVLIRRLEVGSRYVTGNADTSFTTGGSAVQRVALGAAFDGLQFRWDGKDDQGQLVGGRGDDFYRVKIEARDRAGNWAVQDLEGLIKVRGMDVGVHVLQNRTPIASPWTGRPVETDVVFAVYSHDIKSSADFFEKYPTRNLRAFSSLPKVGQYRAVVRDGFGNAVRTFEEIPLRVNDFFVPKTISWDGYDDQHRVVSQGRYFIEVTVSDNAGNGATKNITADDVSIQWDATPPILSRVIVDAAQNAQGEYVTSMNVLYGTAVGAETGSDIADLRTIYRLNSGEWTSVVGSMPLANAEGRQVLAVAMVDAAGNTSNIQTLSVYKDTQAPVVNVAWQGALDREGAKEVSANGQVVMTILDAQFSDGKAAWAGSTIALSRGTNTIGLSDAEDGDYLMQVTAVDLAGNTTIISQPIHVDKTPPVLDRLGISDYTQTLSTPIAVTARDRSGPMAIDVYRNQSRGSHHEFPDSVGNYETLVQAETEGTYLVTVHLTDRLGNRTTTTRTWVADTSPPTVAVREPAAATHKRGNWYVQPGATLTVGVQDQVSGISTVQYAFNDGPLVSLPDDGRIGLEEGIRRLRVLATDRAGNRHDTTQTFYQDAHAPGVRLENAPTGWQNRQYTVTVVAEDNSSRWNGSLRTFYAWGRQPVIGNDADRLTTDQIPVAQEGERTLYIVMVDEAGNQTALDYVARLDTTPPALNYTSAMHAVENGIRTKEFDGRWANGPGVIAFNVHDTGGAGLARVWYEWNYNPDEGRHFGGDRSGNSSAESVGATAWDANRLYVRVWDKAGNESTAQYTYYLDGERPSATAPVLSGWQNNITQVTATFKEFGNAGLKSAQYKWNNEPYRFIPIEDARQMQSVLNLPGSDGRHQLTLRVEDHASNPEEWSTTYEIDRTVPTVGFNNNGDFWQKQWPAVGLVYGDQGGSGVAEAKYRWEDTAESDIPASRELAPREDGDHVVTMRIKDGAGNQVQREGRYRIDTQAPLVSANAPGANWVKTWPNINLTVRDANVPEKRSGLFYQQVQWDGGPWINLYLSDFPQTLPDGQHVLHVYANDYAGNETDVRYTYWVDTTPPTLRLTGYVPGWQSAPQDLFVSAQDLMCGVTDIRYQWGSQPIRHADLPGMPFAASTLPEGETMLTLWATDGAGNDVMTQQVVRIDRQPPLVRLSRGEPTAPWMTQYPTIVPEILEQGSSGISWVRYRYVNVVTGAEGEWNGYGSGAVILPANDGQYRLEIEAGDVAGNVGRNSWVYRVDRIAPDVLVRGGVSTAWQQTWPAIDLAGWDDGHGQGTGSGVLKVLYRWDGVGEWLDTQLRTAVIPPATDGIHVLVARVQDNALNERTREWTYKIDTTAPVLQQSEMSRTQYNPVNDAPLSWQVAWTDIPGTQIMYTTRVYRAGQMLFSLGTSQGDVGQPFSVSWDGRFPDTDKAVRPSSYTFVMEVQDHLGNTQTATSAAFEVTYQSDSNYTYTQFSSPMIYDSRGTQWAAFANYEKVVLRRSDNGMDWTDSAQLDPVTFTTGEIRVQWVDIQIVEMASPVGVRVFATRVPDGARFRWDIPRNFEGFDGATLTLGSGKYVQVYRKNDSMETPFDPSQKIGGSSRSMGPISYGTDRTSIMGYGSQESHLMVWGFLQIPDSQQYEFALVVDDGGRLWLGGKTVMTRLGVNNDPPRYRAQFKPRQLVPYVLYTWNTGGGPGYAELQYRVAGSNGPFSVVPASWFKVDRSGTFLAPIVNGFSRGIRSQYWSERNMDYLRSSEVKESMPWTYDWPGGRHGQYNHVFSYWGINWSSVHVAQFFVRTAGYFRFRLASDDGRRLFIDGNKILESWDDSSGIMETNAIYLSQGFHAIRVDHRQGPGDASVDLKFQRQIDGAWPGYHDFQDGDVYIHLMGETLVSPGGFTSMSATVSVQAEAPVILSPTDNVVLLTNKPTFVWRTAEPAFSGVDIVLRAEPAASQDTAAFSQMGTDTVLRLLPPEVRVAGDTLTYTLDADDALPAGHWRWEVAEISTGNVRTVSTTSEMFELDPGLEVENVINYPNPFTTQTRIRYKLSKDADFVTIKIYTPGGKLVRELDGTTFGTRSDREYNDVVWDGTNDYGQPVNNGPYLYTVTVVSDRETRVARGKMFRLR